MLNSHEATQIVQKNLPNGNIQGFIEYRNVYLFKVFRDDPFEEEMDPFFSVDKDTGEFMDFSIFTDGNMSEILTAFEQGGIK